MRGLQAMLQMFLAFCLCTGATTLWAQGTPPSGQSENPGALPSSPQAAPEKPKRQGYVFQDYSQSVRPFPNVVAPYAPRHVPPPDFANTVRIDQLLRDGKLYLSMDDAIALALENNLDLVLARYNLNIADTDILRARAGSNILGVNTGIVQNTPGGGVGG